MNPSPKIAVSVLKALMRASSPLLSVLSFLSVLLVVIGSLAASQIARDARRRLAARQPEIAAFLCLHLAGATGHQTPLSRGPSRPRPRYCWASLWSVV
jgi:hypothetical protein